MRSWDEGKAGFLDRLTTQDQLRKMQMKKYWTERVALSGDAL